MVKRLTGLNPLAYLGVDPSTPTDTVQSQQSPTSNDTNFVIGTVWLTINKTGPVYEVWQLMNLAGGEATWVQLYPGSGGSGAVNFITNSGTAVESAGTITINGGSNINTSGAGSTVTVNLDNTVSISGQFTAHGDIVSSTGNIVASAGQLACLGDALVGGTLTVDSMANGAVFADAGGALSASNGTNGQLIIGGGTTPLWADVTAGTGISVTTGANTLTISATGGGIGWTEVTTTSANMSVNNGYVANNAGVVTLTMPVTAALGDSIEVLGKGAGGWSIAQNLGQTIHFGNSNTTSGIGGSLSSTNRYDSVVVKCITANTDFVVIGVQGNLTIV